MKARVHWLLFLALGACGGQLAPYDLPAECVPSRWLPCHWEALNGDPHARQVCAAVDDPTGETWYYYASGETFHVQGANDVLCHLGPNGEVWWRVGCPGGDHPNDCRGLSGQ